jgi:thiamine-monophosphate kinase
VRENQLIAALRGEVSDPEGMLGIGSDCCEWTPGGRTCLSVDALVEGLHFTSDADPALVGRKAAAAALSDLAAAGARPVGAVVALSCPTRWDGLVLMTALAAELHRHGCALLGGDTTGAERLVISVTVWGEAVAGRLLRRSGARVGDLLVVTGPLGGSLASSRHLRPEPRFREGQWLAGNPYVTAAMDLSDGLASDAPRLAELNGCGCVLLPDEVPVHADVPVMSDQARAACCDGEDFELLVAVDAAHWPQLQLAWTFERPLMRVGWLIPQPGTFIEDRRGQLVPLPWRGFEHGAD